MLSRTSRFEPDTLAKCQPQSVMCQSDLTLCPLYPKGYKGGLSVRSDVLTPRAAPCQVRSGWDARSFLLGASAHCPQAPPPRLALLATCRNARYAGRGRRAEPLRTQQSGCSKLKEVYQRSCVYDSCFC